MGGFKLKYLFTVLGFALVVTGISIVILPSGKQMGILQMESYQYEESLERLHAAYDKNPKDLVTLKYLSRLYNILGKPDKEIFYLEEYVKLRPKDLKTREELAKVYLWNLKPEPAKKQFLAILDVDPNNIGVLRKLASSYLWEQHYQDSLDCYNRIDKIGKLNFDDYKTLIKIYMGFPDLNKAVDIYIKIKKNFPDQFKDDEYLGMSSLYLWLKEKRKAFDLLDEMLKRTDNLLAAKLSVIGWHIDKGIPKQVIPKAKAWIREEPKNIVIREALIDLYLQERMNEEAILELKDTIRYIQTRDKYLTQLYWLLIEEKKEEAAYQVSKEISDEMKEQEDMWASLGYLSLSLKKYSESYLYWKKVKKKEPDSFEAHDGLFEYYRLTNQPELADQEFEWLIERRPDYPHYIEYQLYKLMKQKEYNEAFKVSQRAFEIDPENLYFQEVLLECSRKLENWEIASKFSLKLYESNPESFIHMSNFIDILIYKKQFDKVIPILNDAEFIHQKNDDILFKISQYYSYCNKPFRQLEILKKLEEQKEGLQYEDQILTLALNHEMHDLAKEILVRRLKENKEDKDSFVILFNLYEASSQYNLQKPMLEHPSAKSWLGIDLVRDKQIEFAENAGHFPLAIKLLEDKYKDHSQKESIRKRILKLAGWANQPELEKQLFLKYAKAEGKDGIKLAYLHYEEKKFKSCLNTLSQLDEKYKDSVQAWELRYYCAPLLKDDELYQQALAFLITNEPDNNKRALYFAERAAIYYGKGQLQKAMEDAQFAIEFNPNLNDTKIILGYIHYDRREFRKSVDYFKDSKISKLYDRFLLGAGLIRYQEGYREGMRQFHKLMSEYRSDDSFTKWNLYLDIGYEINSSHLIENAWDNIMQKYYKEELLPRYALHLLYTDRKRQAESIFKNLKASEEPSYIALQKVFAPKSYKGELSINEKLALADALNRTGRWFEATQWLK